MRNRTLVAALLVAVSALALSLHLSLWAGLSSQQVRNSDYTVDYIAAHTWLSGDGAHLYDRGVQLAGHVALHTSPGAAGLGYVYPPLAAVVASPFSLLGFEASYRAFGVFQLLLILAAVVIALRAAPWPRSTPRLMKAAIGLLALAGTGTGVTLYLGQWDGVGTLGLALAYAAWRRQRPGWAAVAIVVAFGLTKPHLAFGLMAFLIARGERRALGGAVAAAVGMIAASLLLVGVHGTAAFISAPGISTDVSPFPTMLGLSGLVYSNLHPSLLAEALVVLGAAVGVAMAAALGRVARRDPARLEVALAGAVALSLLSTPHLLVQDLVVLAPALVWCAARAAQALSQARPPSRRELGLVTLWLALSGAAAVDIGNGSVGFPGRLVPWVLLAIAGIAASACRTAPATAPRLEAAAVSPG
jgi:hypothetical protein